MRMNLPLIVFPLLLMLAFPGLTQAGLWDPALLNPSFESVENGADPGSVGNWGYTIDDWYEYQDTTQVFWEKGAGHLPIRCRETGHGNGQDELLIEFPGGGRLHLQRMAGGRPGKITGIGF